MHSRDAPRTDTMVGEEAGDSVAEFETDGVRRTHQNGVHKVLS